MRFGAFIPQGWRLDLMDIPVDRQWHTMLGVAGVIEQAGYESIWVYDHFHTSPGPAQEPTYEAWTLMAALAAVTNQARLGQMCTCNGYRPPAYLAKVAACVDVISGGRLEMGIGAGWYEQEFRAYGYEFPDAGPRLAMLAEAVDVLLAMWSQDEAHYEGRHYRLEGAINRPRPVQDPHPPLWIAGGGEQLTLKLAARHADYTNFGVSLAEFERKSDVLAGHCEQVGRPFDEIVRSSNFDVVIAASESEISSQLAWLEDRFDRYRSGRSGLPYQEAYRRRHLVGTPAEVSARLDEWGDAGLDYAILYFPEAAYDSTGLELFAQEVMPTLA